MVQHPFSFAQSFEYLQNKGRARKNVIAGAIFTVLIFIFGCFWLFFSSIFEYAKAYIGKVSQTVSFVLPEGEIITHALNESYSFNNKKTIKESRVKYNSDELSEIIQNRALWKPKEAAEENQIKKILPDLLFVSHKYDYFMVYVKELNLYNEKPAGEKEYEMIFLGYNVKNNSLYILEMWI